MKRRSSSSSHHRVTDLSDGTTALWRGRCFYRPTQNSLFILMLPSVFPQQQTERCFSHAVVDHELEDRERKKMSGAGKKCGRGN